MKQILLCIALFGLFNGVMHAQTIKKDGKHHTLEMQVKGVCTMCEVRIESAVYDIKGVKSVDWDKDTQILTAVFNARKTSPEKIAEALAKAGHASALSDADPKAYAGLPDCCKYDDGIEPH